MLEFHLARSTVASLGTLRTCGSRNKCTLKRFVAPSLACFLLQISDWTPGVEKEGLCELIRSSDDLWTKLLFKDKVN